MGHCAFPQGFGSATRTALARRTCKKTLRKCLSATATLLRTLPRLTCLVAVSLSDRGLAGDSHKKEDEGWDNREMRMSRIVRSGGAPGVQQQGAGS